MVTDPISLHSSLACKLTFFLLLVGAVLCAHAQVPAVPDVPENLTGKVRASLLTERDQFANQREAFLGKAKAHNARCNDVVLKSAEADACVNSRNSVVADLATLRIAAVDLQEAIDAAWTIDRINAYVNQGPQPWGSKERERVDKALNALAFAGDPNARSQQIRETWQSIVARGQPAELAKKAIAGSGSGFYGAGQQNHEDCTVFAIANAAGRPFGLVAAMANKFMTGGEWRSASDRENSQKAIERQGLNGGEVILLAEAFGQVSVVEQKEFAATLKQGRPVMINLVPQNGDVRKGHQVVLTKTFQHDKTTWYEMIDSNQAPEDRRYLNAAELWIVMKENGVSVRPEPGTVPKLLR